MGWFKRKSQGIFTDSKFKKDVPKGLWYKCPKCKQLTPKEEHEKHYSVCPYCDYHTRINSIQYFSILFDNQKYIEINKNLKSLDPLSFEDTKKYKDRLIQAEKETLFHEAINTAHGEINGKMIAVGVMNFEFIGGSISSAVGEKYVGL